MKIELPIGTRVIMISTDKGMAVELDDKPQSAHEAGEPCTVRRNAHIVKDEKPKYEVGQIVELKGTNGLPTGKYRVLATGRTPEPGELWSGIYKMSPDEPYFVYRAEGLGWSDNRMPIIVAPMPETGWYDFEVAGVKCRVYKEKEGRLRCMTEKSSGYYVIWGDISIVFSTTILDAVDARLKRERGEGIRVIPYAVSNGVFEAPKGEE